MTVQTFKQLARQHTGRSILDSGDFYGRHYERPLPKKPILVSCDKERKEFNVSISTVAFLEEHFEIDTELTKEFRLIDKNLDEAMEVFAKRHGLGHVQSDNTYNHENDLSQDFQFTILSESADWCYDEEALWVISTHNGCDIRGGYSDRVVCRSSSDSKLDWVVGVSFVEGKDSDGTELDMEALQALDEGFQVGYTSNPLYAFNETVAEIHSGRGNNFRVTLKSGETVKGYFSFRDGNGGVIY
jgi:hypothetical protein